MATFKLFAILPGGRNVWRGSFDGERSLCVVEEAVPCEAARDVVALRRVSDVLNDALLHGTLAENGRYLKEERVYRECRYILVFGIGDEMYYSGYVPALEAAALEVVGPALCHGGLTTPTGFDCAHGRDNRIVRVGGMCPSFEPYGRIAESVPRGESLYYMERKVAEATFKTREFASRECERLIDRLLSVVK